MDLLPPLHQNTSNGHTPAPSRLRPTQPMPASMPIRRTTILLRHRPPHPHSFSQLLKHLNRGIPVNTRVRNGYSALQACRPLGRHLLVALMQMRLDHDTDDPVLTFAELIANGLRDFGLVFVVLLRVAWEGTLSVAGRKGVWGNEIKERVEEAVCGEPPRYLTGSGWRTPETMIGRGWGIGVLG